MDRLRLYVYKTAHVPKRQFQISKAMLSYSNKHMSDINSKSVLHHHPRRPPFCEWKSLFIIYSSRLINFSMYSTSPPIFAR